MNVEEIVEGLSYNERKLILALDRRGGKASPADVISDGTFSLEVEVMGAASWLQNKGLAAIDEKVSKFYIATESAKNGLPERRAIEAIAKAGGKMTMEDLAKALPDGEDKIAVGWMKRKDLADIVKEGNTKALVLTDTGKEMLNRKMMDEDLLKRMSVPFEEDANPIVFGMMQGLKGRQGMIEEKIVVKRTITLTEEGRKAIALGIDASDEAAQITTEMIQSGKWKNVKFRKYDVQTFAPSVAPSKKHPLSRLGAEIREIFTQMGFKEVDEEYVQPAFWNLDVLYTPQDHPARELQDTFYLQRPSKIRIDDEELVKKVKDIHENGGGTGSTGWGGKWSREKAELALLRTHTTINTIKHISKNPNPPVKVFSLSRIFRNESIDATHLPEFTQIEGIIIDENGNFDMLVSLIKTFYGRMGFDQIRIRPAYFPYTEPSLEVEVFFNGKWMELGGAGIFRPEVTAPFGVKHPVLAWGFGFERLAMLKWNITDIRDLYISDIDLLKKSTVF